MLWTNQAQSAETASSLALSMLANVGTRPLHAVIFYCSKIPARDRESMHGVPLFRAPQWLRSLSPSGIAIHSAPPCHPCGRIAACLRLALLAGGVSPTIMNSAWTDVYGAAQYRSPGTHRQAVVFGFEHRGSAAASAPTAIGWACLGRAGPKGFSTPPNCPSVPIPDGRQPRRGLV